MNKLYIALLAAGFCFSSGVMAQDKKPAAPATEKSTGTPPSTQKSMDQPKANETVLGSQGKGAPGARIDAKAENKRINDDYSAAKKACDKLKGKEEDQCEKSARDTRSKARADLQAREKQARADAKAATRTATRTEKK